jgi:hypothetical protein
MEVIALLKKIKTVNLLLYYKTIYFLKHERNVFILVIYTLYGFNAIKCIIRTMVTINGIYKPEIIPIFALRTKWVILFF